MVIRTPRLFVLGIAPLALLALASCADEDSPPNPWGTDGFVAGEPFAVAEADEESWQYVPIDGMVCGDGSDAGVFLNFTSQSRELVFFLMGGGICYDEASCGLLEDNLQGLGEDPLAGFPLEAGIFDREASENPFREANFVVVPHCTGDFHLADSLVEHPRLGTIHQRGRSNLMRVIRRAVPAFEDATRITFAGFSAGGVGVTGNYHLFATAFATTGAPLPFLINDAGPLMRAPYLNAAGQQRIAEQWKLAETLFTWCPRCQTEGLHTAFATLHALYPGLRSSLICTYDDVTVKALYTLIASFRIPSADFLRDGLVDYASWSETSEGPQGPGAHRQFAYEGTRHGALVVAPLDATPGLLPFLNAQLGGGDDFQSVP